MKITQIPTDHVESSWGKAAKLLEPAVKKSRERWSMESLYCHLRIGSADLWFAYEDDTKKVVGAAVTTVREFPTRKVMEIVFLGGKELDAWISEGMRVFREYALTLNCDGIEVVGRHGLLKKLKAEGFEAPYTVYECNLKRITL